MLSPTRCPFLLAHLYPSHKTPLKTETVSSLSSLHHASTHVGGLPSGLSRLCVCPRPGASSPGALPLTFSRSQLPDSCLFVLYYPFLPPPAVESYLLISYHFLILKNINQRKIYNTSFTIPSWVQASPKNGLKAAAHLVTSVPTSPRPALLTWPHMLPDWPPPCSSH